MHYELYGARVLAKNWEAHESQLEGAPKAATPAEKNQMEAALRSPPTGEMQIDVFTDWTTRNVQ